MKTENVALLKKKQGRFNKKVSHISNKVKKGEIVIKETITKKPAKETRGLVYIGHLPHGFYEEEMRQYFKQFGNVTNIRVCRSVKTGHSKGYGFVEFADDEVSKVVAETMNNYLMFSRRLEAKYIPPEKRRKHYFAGPDWSETNFPLKAKREKLNRVKNTNKDPATYLKNAKAQLKIVQGQLKKLAELGIVHKFQPVDIPTSLEGTIKLIDGNDSNEDSVIFQEHNIVKPKRQRKKKLL